MSRLEAVLRRIARDLADRGCPWALVGGLAVSIRTEPRFTILARDDRTRPQDRGDLVALVGVAGSAEVARARDAVGLIRERGFHRGRDLAGDLERLLHTITGPGGSFCEHP